MTLDTNDFECTNLYNYRIVVDPDVARVRMEGVGYDLSATLAHEAYHAYKNAYINRNRFPSEDESGAIWFENLYRATQPGLSSR